MGINVSQEIRMLRAPVSHDFVSAKPETQFRGVNKVLNLQRRVLTFTGCSVISLMAISPVCLAQTTVVGDGSLGSLVNGSSLDACTGGICEITGGTTINDYLFHSLESFSLGSGDVAQFDSANVSTIVTRVTGGSLSDIDGQISTTLGNADFFLLNPSGILFGPNASLDIGGSFVASTADHLVFDNNAIFDSTTTTFDSALLQINVPVGLQYGRNPDAITVQGSGNGLFIDPDTFGTDRSNRPTGLAVDRGKTLALLGGDITLQGGNVTAEAGQVELGSVGPNSLIALQSNGSKWQFDYDDVDSVQDIRLSRAASIDTSGGGSGRIHVYGDHLLLKGGSVLLSLTSGGGTGGPIVIQTDETHIRGTSGTYFSGVFNDVDPGAPGQGGNVRIRTEALKLSNGGQVSATTLGDGNSGDLFITADLVRLTGTPRSFILSANAPVSTGEGGSIRLNTDSLYIQDGSQVVTSTFGAGPAGDLLVNAEAVVLSGADADNTFFSGLEALGVFGEGGNITVNADSLTIDGGAAITTRTFASGTAGNIQVNASKLTMQNTASSGSPSGIFATVFNGAPGNGGSINVNAESLQVLEGANLTASTFGTGDAGEVTVTADRIQVAGTTTDGFPSGIFAQAEVDSLGNSGNVLVQGKTLDISGGGQIAASTFGEGQAGFLEVNMESIELSDTTETVRSGLFAGALVSTGDGGDLLVQADRLTIRDGATISTSNFQSQGLLDAGQGSAGNLTIKVPLIYVDNIGLIQADTAVGNQGNITINTDALILQDASRISTNANSADGGNIQIDAGAIVALNNSDISANASEGLGGRVVVSADGLFSTAFRPNLTPNSDITASSDLGPSFSGEVVINTPDVDPSRGLAELPETLADVSDQVTTTCEQSNDSDLVITGAGSIPHDPYQVVQPQSLWPDIRFSENFRRENRTASGQQHDTNRSTTVEDSPLSQLQEAQSWWVNDQGSVVLEHSAYNVRPNPNLNCGLQ